MLTNIEEIVTRFKLANPWECQYLGVQSTYGKVPNYDQMYITNRIAELKANINFIKSQLKNEDKIKHSKLELEALIQRLDLELFNLEDLKEYQDFPLVYISILTSIQLFYVSRNYASLETRTKHIIETEKAIPELIEQAYKNLNKRLPKARIEMTLLRVRPLVAYLRDELMESLIPLENKELLEEWSQINVQTIEVVETFLERLEKEYLPNSDESFALGEKKYLKFLEKSEGIQTTVEKLLAISEKDLEKNYQEIQLIKKELGSEKYKKLSEECPKEEELVHSAKNTIQLLIDFVVEKDLLTIPSDEECIVTETPSSRRASTFAAMNPSNIAEESQAKESYYYITPPDKKWTKKERENYMKTFNKGFLNMATGHEVIPGHFLHFLHIRNLSPLIRLLGFSITTIEGWAHYTEELLIEQKYDKIDPVQAHIGQLLAALQRNCRFVVSINMHCKGMTVDEAKDLFMKRGLMSEKAALMEARRGTIDPLFLNYTLGKLIIKKLRRDYKKEQGSDYTLKKFHDTLLSYGAIPLTMTRKYMLKNPGKEEDIL